MNKRIVLALFVIFIASSCAKPVADFIIENDEVEAPGTVKFTNQSDEVDSYFWDFGDGKKSSLENPEHMYYLSGQYTVKLMVKKGKKSNTMEKNVKVNPPNKCLVELDTKFGAMLIELYDDTPEHRDNFIKLAEEGFFNDLLFHRVIDGFMIQGGDPNSRNAAETARLGAGGPGYQIPAEFNEDLVHTKGALAAARQGDPVNPEKRSSGSQFYIVHGGPVSAQMLDRMEMQKGIVYSDENRALYEEVGGTPFLDNEYTVFGRVIDGLDVIDKIAAVQTQPGDRPVEDVKMSIKVIK